MAEAHIVGRAVVQVVPVFNDSQRTIAKEVTPAAKRAGKDAGREAGKEMGDGVAKGLREKTRAVEREITRLGKAATTAVRQVNAATQKSTAAADKERAAADAVAAATERLQAARGKSSTTAKQLIAAERALTRTLGQQRTAQAAAVTANEQLNDARQKLTTTQNDARAATERLTALQDGNTSSTEKSTEAAEKAVDARRHLTAVTDDATAATEKSTAANAKAERGTRSYEREVRQYGRAVTAASQEVEKAAARAEESAQREREAQNDVRESTKRLNDLRSKSSTQMADLVFAQRDLARDTSRLTVAQDANAESAQRLNAARDRASSAQKEFSASSERLSVHLRTVTRETSNAERGMGRFASGIKRAFDRNGSPLRNLSDNINRDSDSITTRLRTLSTDIGNSGTRGGRAFTRFASMFTLALVAIPPLLGGLSAGLIAAVGAVVTFSDSLTDMVGVAALAPAALVAVGGAVGVLRAAFAGMGEALSESVKSQAKIANDGAANAAALEDAAARIADAEEYAGRVSEQSARRISDAQRDVADATVQAAENREAALRDIVAAERDVERTNRRVTDSQKALNDARREAADRIKDLKDQLTGAALSERDAAIRLEEAQIDLAAGKSEGLDPGSLGMRKLVLDVDQAQFALKEAKERTVELGEEQKNAAEAGVNGNENVIRAVRDLNDAQQEARDAVEARKMASEDLTKVELAGARLVGDAERNLADARRSAAEDQKDAADAIADAQRAYLREQLRQADKAADATAKADEAMAKLSPNARAAAEALLSVYDRLKGIKNVIQDNFFAGFTAPLMLMADTLLPELEVGAARIATALGAGAQQLMTSLTGALDNGVLESLLTSVSNIITNLNPAIDPLVQAFVTLAMVGMPYLEDMATAISDMAEQFNIFIQGAAADGSLDTFIQDGITAFKDMGRIIAGVTGIMNSLAEAARAGGIDASLGNVATWLEKIDGLMKGETFQTTMATIFGGAAEGAKGLGEGLKMVGDAFVTGGPAFADFLSLGGEILGLFMGNLATMLADPAFGEGLTNFMTALRDGARDVTPLLPGLSKALGDLLTDVGPIFEKLGPTLIEVLTGLATALEKIVEFLEPALTAFADSPAAVGLFLAAFVGTGMLAALATFAANIAWILSLGGQLGNVFRFLTKHGGKFFRIFSAALGPIGWVVLGLTALYEGLKFFFTQTELGRELWAGFTSGLRDAWESVSNWFMNEMLPALESFFTDIPGNMAQLGKDIILGLLNGISDGQGQQILDALGRIVNSAIQWVKDLFGIQSPSKVFAEIGDFLIQGLVNGIKGAGQLILDALGAIQTFFSDTWTNITTTISNATEGIRKGIDRKLAEIDARWTFMWRSVKNYLAEIWRGIKAVIGDAIEWVRSWINTKLTNIKRNWAELWDGIKTKVSDVWNGITTVVSDAWTDLKSTLTTLIDFVKNNLADAFETAKDGIDKSWKKLQDVAKSPVKFVIEEVIQKGIIEKFNGFLPKGMKIPSVKVPEGWRKGGYTGDGDAAEIAGPVHRGEYVFSKAQTAMLGKENLAAMAHGAIRKGRSAKGCDLSHAATIGGGNMGGFFEGNAANIRQHGAYHLKVASGMDAWNFPGAARMWDGAAGIKVKTGFGKHQGYAYPRERGGGILGYAMGNNIDMSPSWMARLGATQRRTVAAHEMGHAMGLPHNSLRSIMQPNLGNMASAPTSVDIKNLQHLYPGGSGKAGNGGPAENPFKGIFTGLINTMVDKFPGNLIAKVAGGVAIKGIDKVFSMVEDIKNGIGNLVGNVVNGVKNFFGGGEANASEPMLFRDEGGYIPPGISRILNATGQNEYALTPRQVNDMHSYVMGSGPRGGGDTYNVQLPEKSTVEQLVGAVGFQQRKNARGGARR